MNFLSSGAARVLTLVLVIQAAVYYTVARRSEVTPAIAPLASFPQASGAWRSVQEVQVEKEVQDVLRADDTLNRVYVRSGKSASAFLFVAYFKTQRYGQAPHSPKNCLPGSGWEPLSETRISIPVPGRAQPIVSNQYVVGRGDMKSVTLYWYQSHDRVIASEWSAKFWLIADAIRYHRSDTSLVRIVVPVSGDDVDGAIASGVEFVKALFPDLTRQLPS